MLKHRQPLCASYWRTASRLWTHLPYSALRYWTQQTDSPLPATYMHAMHSLYKVVQSTACTFHSFYTWFFQEGPEGQWTAIQGGKEPSLGCLLTVPMGLPPLWLVPLLAATPSSCFQFSFISSLLESASLPSLREKSKAGQCPLLQGQHPSLAGPGCVLRGTSWETAAPPPRPEAQLPRVLPPSDPTLKVTTYVFLQYCLLLFIPPKFVYLIPYVKFSLLK